MYRRDLWKDLCHYNNLILAYKKARKHKTTKTYVIEFEKNLKNNLLLLQTELQLKSYEPKPLITFTIRDPKTRKISKSDFRGRVIHHVLCNIIEPIFDRTFIHDSYANQKGKGTLNAIKRFEHFKRCISKNNTKTYFVLKADIKHYFDNVDHTTLIQIIKKKILDPNIIWLIKIILTNHKTTIEGKGMPLGNLTSQFFANVYLNELDYYVKNELSVKYYIRYVDDFVILSNSKAELIVYQEKINKFLLKELRLTLHPEKTKTIDIHQGTGFLGLRMFEHHKLLKKSNTRKFKNKLRRLCEQYDNKEVDYDKIYDAIEGWTAHIKNADTHNLKNKVLNPLEYKFANEMSTKEYNRRLKHTERHNFIVSQIAENKDNI